MYKPFYFATRDKEALDIFLLLNTGKNVLCYYLLY